MTLTDAEIRHLAISLLTAPTARDQQTRIGASDLSNGCDFCLGSKFLGLSRDTGLSERTWMGRTLGTATHLILEKRVADAIAEQQHQFTLLEGAETEKHVWFADFRGYGQVGGSIDLLLAPLRHIVDWKGSTRKKTCLLIDYMEMQAGRDPIYGRTHKEIKLSEKVYAEEMAKMAYKVTGYFGQQTLYGHSGVADRMSLVLFARDGTGYFDVPHLDRYEDPKAVHDVHVVSFDYDQAYAEALIARGQAIYDHLQGGGSVANFDRHQYCFPCSMDTLQEAKAAPDVDIELTLEVAA